MKLEKYDKPGQGRGAFNPATRVQIPVGAFASKENNSFKEENSKEGFVMYNLKC